MTQETALGAALKSAVQTMSKKKQTDMIADYLYSKYDVFKRFKMRAEQKRRLPRQQKRKQRRARRLKWKLLRSIRKRLGIEFQAAFARTIRQPESGVFRLPIEL